MNDLAKRSLRFVLVMGVVNLFADMTYEGARGEVGAFLGHLGASGALVGLIAGGGELAGYAIRWVSGTIADRTGLYWIEAWVGYLINLLCVPALALAGSVPAAAGLIIGERLGRGIRRPVISSVFAEAGRQIGSGKAFGLNELLDQIGATVGPLIVAYAVARGGFSLGFGVLIVPALVALGLFVPASTLGSKLAPDNPAAEGPTLRDPRAFWRYAVGGGLMAAGFVDFALIAFRFQRDHIVSTPAISIWFAVAMAVGAVGSYVLGRMFDRYGNVIVAGALVLTAAVTPLTFLGSGAVAEAGAALWGTGTAVQDALLLALVATVITQRRGATTFGLYDFVFGASWFVGSAVSGVLLDTSVIGLVIFSVLLQLSAIPFFVSKHKAR